MSTPNLSLSLPHFSFSWGILLNNPVLWVIGGLLLLMMLSTVWRIARVLFGVTLVVGGGWGLSQVANAVNHAVQSKGAGHHHALFSMPSLTATGKLSQLSVLSSMQTINAGVMVVIVIVLLVGLLLFGLIKSSGYSMGYVMNRMWVYFTAPIARGGRKDIYDFPDAAIGVGIGEAEPGLPGASEKAGKQMVIKAKDRFLNMGIVGPIGSGKTFMTMKPEIYQDLEHIAQGIMANVMWISPQPEPSVELYAESLGITVRRIHLIDGQVNGKTTNIRFNPLSGNDIDSVISNVNIMLNEQTGDKAKGAAFFDDMAAQATTDSLQLYKYLHGFDPEGNVIEIDMISWYDRYLVRMDELFFDATRVNTIAEREINGLATIDSTDTREAWIRNVVWSKLTDAEKTMLRRAAASIINEFGGDVDGKNAEAYKNIIRGLRGKVRVLISSQYVQELLGRENEQAKDRPNFSFESWIDPPAWIPPTLENTFPQGGWFRNWMNKFKYRKYVDEQMKAWKAEAPTNHRGELLSVITGQTDTGKLVGRMVLVFEQQAVLNRPGRDNDKPPVYAYVDEYPSYATRSVNEIRTQGRKHCHSMVMAHQSRGQMDEVARNYRRTLEGSTRHWVYLSNLGFEDAEDVAKMCGKVKRIRRSTAVKQLRMGGLGADNGQPLVTKSEQEELVDRFSADFIRYGLGKNEVLYMGVDDRQGQRPLRMRIVEPRENKALVKKQAATPVKQKKPAKKAPPKVSTYPPLEAVAKVKWPIASFGEKTLYIYRWGMAWERDAHAHHQAPTNFSETPPTPPTLLMDVLGEDFFHPPKEQATEPLRETKSADDELAQRAQDIKSTFGKRRTVEEAPAPTATANAIPVDEGKVPTHCTADNVELVKHGQGEKVFYQCPACGSKYDKNGNRKSK